ncbi:RDD family protein [Mangrovibacterium marinum]|uniref:Putative RDD family membrane protein YckC n=1 Tax=Mangrovibacterium marinum TaxID=1639118 RepID=A0A2T5BZA3_9BACT|nr:RDD family protein [Mangrovibacterium marinum]PTN07595.1 putative RDD family membrane protein YckC [Mangrovibacterium marinum]
MTDLKIQTAQNTQLALNNAGLGDRILAAIVDLILMFAYAMIGFILTRSLALGNVFLMVYLLPVYFYSLILELLFHGQTLGKMLLKIKVVHQLGRQVPFSSYLLRWLLRIIDVWIFFAAIGICTIVLTRRGLRVGDLAANTLVISLKGSRRLDELSYVRGEAEAPVFAQAALLDDPDISVIREVLAYGREVGFHGKAAQLVLQTTNIIKKKIGVETELKPIPFLEQLLKDYCNIHQ